jgi:hypothetical protein
MGRFGEFTTSGQARERPAAFWHIPDIERQVWGKIENMS